MHKLDIKDNRVFDTLKFQPHLVSQVDTSVLTSEQKRNLLLLNPSMVGHLDTSDFSEVDIYTLLILQPHLVYAVPTEKLGDLARSHLVRHRNELAEALAVNV